MTEEGRPEGGVSEGRVALPYVHMVLVGALFLLLMLVKFEDPVPEWRTPLMIGLGVAVPVSAFLLGARTLKQK
ncbi:hypothetical protein O4J56_10120 [Nocardiopsis sp. RSe5-2]|uniref:DUF2530 domain-containing protein n=1 Tax=Nocardiopsis endophytica TaxID=3018445 RepID=A0ABT4U225_9ACTN|nr:hypothetical protein [Nocardiopsis endophytica]MDA2810991.1 hypothetical protein [Nocardiopsis endophytica]